MRACIFVETVHVKQTYLIKNSFDLEINWLLPTWDSPEVMIFGIIPKKVNEIGLNCKHEHFVGCTMWTVHINEWH